VRKEKDKIERGEISRRDFLIGAGSVVVGGAIGAGITYPLVAGKEKEVVTTKTVEVSKTVTAPATTVTTTVAADTVTTTKTVGGVQPWQEPETTHIMQLTFH
jgi:hypothetical protein